MNTMVKSIISVVRKASKKTNTNNLMFAVSEYDKYRSIYTNIILEKRRKSPEERKVVNSKEYSPKSKQPLVQIWRDITPREIGNLLQKDLNYVSQLFLDKMGNPDVPIEDIKLLQQVIRRSGHRMEIIGRPTDSNDILEDKDVYPRPPAKETVLKSRPPVVTIMGHVDHGKTTLLDALRHSSIVEREFGGITQHIGAFSVLLDSGARVTFLDTPGHAAFSTMRARGANITDIVVLVVAADDGVMEQTIESVKMAQHANVPILIAINKIDAPKANIERTKRTLLEIGLQVEDLGGDVQTVSISALKRQNLDVLVEALVLQAELLEIKADYTGPIEAVIVESKIDPSRGKLSTIVVKRGTLKKGAILVAGTCYGKVKVIKDADNQTLREVTPGYAAEIDGWKDLPSAGDIALEVESERRAKEVIQARERKKSLEKQEKEKVVISEKAKELRNKYEEQLQLRRKLGRFKLKPDGPRKPEIQDDENKIEFNILIKADVVGSAEAILDTLNTYDSDLCELDLIHHGVGPITESDVQLAEAFKAVIYAFNVDCPDKVKEMAKEIGVSIKTFNVIYKLVDDVKLEINSRIPPIEVEEICGEATVLQEFEITEGRRKISTAGCRCTKGILKKSGIYKLFRNGELIYTGPLTSLRHLKNEVDSIKTNVECGLQVQDRTITFKQGDSVQCLDKVLKPQILTWDPGF